MDIHLEGVEIEGKGADFHLEGVYIHTYIHTYIYIYYYTPLPLNLANKQQQATTSTSPCRFGHCAFPTPRARLYFSHSRAWVVPLPNPSLEPKTHRWRPGAVAPSRKVPSQICGVLGQKQPFFDQNSPSTGPKQPNEGKPLLHSTCGLTFS